MSTGASAASNVAQITTTPYTPAWPEKNTTVPRDQIIQVAREFRVNAEKTDGRSMVIVGAALNHWYHNDMNYRGIINMLMMCGCVGQCGGGWSHYVGQEKLRPQFGWAPLAFGLDWSRPPRQMNSAPRPSTTIRASGARKARAGGSAFADRARRPLEVALID